MNNKYFEENENLDWKLLLDFNEKLKIQNLKRTKEKSQYDAEGKVPNGKDLIIELKSRNCDYNPSNNTMYNSNEIMIQPDKLIDLMLTSRFEDKIPLFINFTKNGYKIVFNLDNLNIKPRKEYVRTKNIGYNGIEKEIKYFLNLKDALIYDPNNNIVKH